MKVVVDTNVFISSFLNPQGNPKQVINLWKKGKITLCLCSEILEEYIEILNRMGLQGEPEVKELLELFKTGINIDFVTIDHTLEVVMEDHEDNKFIECAMISGAEMIISGDRHLTDIKQYGGIVIVTPAEFITHLRLPGGICE